MTLMLMSSFSPLDDPNDSQYPNSSSNRQRQRQDQLQQQRQPQEDNTNTPFPSSFLPHSGTTATEKDGSSNHKNTANATTGVTWMTSSATTATTAVTATTTAAAASPAASSGLGYGYHCAKPKSLFPWKLRQLINDAMVEGNAGIVSWLPDGTGFKVYEPELFASQILKRYFRQSHFRSFTRQLYHYGFERVQTGPNRGAFCHELFQRDNESLCLSMGHKHRGSASAAAIKDNRQQLLGSNPSHHSSSRLTHCRLPPPPPPPPPPQMTTKNSTHNRIFGTGGAYSNPIPMPVMQQDHIAAPAFHNSVSLSTQIYPIVHSSPNVARGVKGGNGKGKGAEGVQMMMDCFTQSQQQLMLIQKQQPRQYYQSQSPQQPQNPFNLNNNNTDSELTPDCIEALLTSLKDIPNESQPTTHTPQEEASRPDEKNVSNLDLLLEPRPIEEMVQLQQKRL